LARGSKAPTAENSARAFQSAKGEKKAPGEVSKEKDNQHSLSPKLPAAELAQTKAKKAEGKDEAAGREETKLKEKNKGDKLASAQMNQNAALALAQAKQPELAKAKTQGKIASQVGDSGNATDKTKKKGETPEIKLTDLRSKDDAKQKLAVQAKPLEAALASADKGASEGGGGSKAELNLDLGGSFALRPGTSGSEGAEKTLGSAPSPHSFSETLVEQLKSNWNNELVQSAHLVLKDGDAGTIRLHLKPESLGGVKIELKLADNCISGKIVVESDEAKSAFERNMASLNDAFKHSGFESAKLEVSVGSGHDNRGGQQGDAPEPFWSERRRLESFDRAVPETQSYAAAGRRPGAVDILA
jgi:flagellar hook-length control protein FliK